jgi:hypothetical protein
MAAKPSSDLELSGVWRFNFDSRQIRNIVRAEDVFVVGVGNPLQDRRAK